MKKIIITLALALAPSMAFAQTIPLSGWPDVIYCTNTDTGGVYSLYQSGIPDPNSSEPPAQYWYANSFPSFSILSFNGQGGNTSNGGAMGSPNDCGESLTDLITSGQAFYFVRSSSPATLPDQHSVRKTVNESVANSIALQDDDSLNVPLIAGKSYIVTGAIFASATNATPDIKIAFTAPNGSDLTIGYTSNAGAGSSGELETSGIASSRIPLPAITKVPIRIDGTVVAGANGTLQLQWAQMGANAAAVTVNKGSYIRVTEIQQ